MHAARGGEGGPLPTLQTLLEKAVASAEAGEAERTRREKPTGSAAAKRRRSAKSEATQGGRRLRAAGSSSGSDQARPGGSGCDAQPLGGLRAGGRERPACGPGQAVTLLLALVGVSGHGSGPPPRNWTGDPTQIAGDRWGRGRAEHCRLVPSRASRDPPMEPLGGPGRRDGESNPPNRGPTGQAAQLGEATAEARAGPSRGHEDANDVPEGGGAGRDACPRATRPPGEATPGGGVRNLSAPCSWQ